MQGEGEDAGPSSSAAAQRPARPAPNVVLTEAPAIQLSSVLPATVCSILFHSGSLYHLQKAPVFIPPRNITVGLEGQRPSCHELHCAFTVNDCHACSFLASVKQCTRHWSNQKLHGPACQLPASNMSWRISRQLTAARAALLITLCLWFRVSADYWLTAAQAARLLFISVFYRWRSRLERRSKRQR